MMLRDIQVDPATDALLHVDFMRLDMSVAMEIKVPVEVLGTAKGVKEQGGRLDFIHRELNVECLPADIPDSITYDVSVTLKCEVIEKLDLSTYTNTAEFSEVIIKAITSCVITIDGCILPLHATEELELLDECCVWV